MRALTRGVAIALAVAVPGRADAQLWTDVSAETIGETGEWSNKVELADLDQDGDVDIIFANGGDYSTGGTPQPNRVFLNTLDSGTAGFAEATESIFGPVRDLARVIKVADLTGDGILDIIVGGAHQTQARLFLGAGRGKFDEMTATNLPQGPTSMGDLEVGDVDGDGHLDIVAVDWGAGDALTNTGGPLILWRGDGSGRFSDASAKLPRDLIKMSWDIELIDIDNDYDLDLLVSCKVCVDSGLYINDGSGTFASKPFDPGNPQPQGVENNYEFEWLDANGDGFLDVVTINDGELDDRNAALDLRERIFINDKKGGFEDATARHWPERANIGADDNAIVVLDVDSDGDPDFLIAALGPDPDRLLINDGKGNLTLDDAVFDGTPTEGTLGIAVADLNGDGKLDVVQAQGELAEDERVYFGKDIVADTAAPIVSLVEVAAGEGMQTIRARVHDNKTPVAAHDFQAVELVLRSGEAVPMSWYGEALWRADAVIAPSAGYQVCAADTAGNRRCVAPGAGEDKEDDVTDQGIAGCQSASRGTDRFGGALLFALAGLIARRRRRACRAARSAL